MSPGHNKSNVAHEITKLLTDIFNIYHVAKYLTNLKWLVIPIYLKKNDNEIFSNYHPVSVLPCFSKEARFNRCIELIDENI